MLPNFNLMKMYYDEASSAGTGTSKADGQGEDQSQNTSNNETIESFLESLDPKLKEKGTLLLNSHIEKLPR
jgi:hypothetical protein